jgi:hypothetical protein
LNQDCHTYFCMRTHSARALWVVATYLCPFHWSTGKTVLSEDSREESERCLWNIL